MKFTTQEEYGLRCLVTLGYAYNKGRGFTIPELSNYENISEHNIAKTLRILRLGGFLESERGRIGGYTLTKPPANIIISDVMNILGGKFFETSYCKTHLSDFKDCTHVADCSIRSFWQILQNSIDNVMRNLTLKDLMNDEQEFESVSKNLILTNN